MRRGRGERGRARRNRLSPPWFRSFLRIRSIRLTGRTPAGLVWTRPGAAGPRGRRHP